MLLGRHGAIITKNGNEKKYIDMGNSMKEDMVDNNCTEEPFQVKRRWSGKRKMCFALVFILLISAGCYGGFRWWLRDKVSSVTTVSNEDILKLAKDYIEEEETDGTDSSEDVIALANATIDEHTNNGFNGVLQDENVVNIMVVGSDTRKENSIGLTDVMILVSINKVSKEVHLTSFMRDTYVSIPGYGNDRLNTAFYHGSDVFFETMKTNFNIEIDKFVYINFFSFIDVIDALGGVEIDVTEKERVAMNTLFAEINKYLGDPKDSGVLEKSGQQVLTGKQALAWARVRKIAGSDFRRTERQRIVLEKVLEKVQELSVLELNDFADVVLPKVMTNMTYGEIEDMLLDAFTYLSYDIEQLRVPEDGTFSDVKIKGKEVLSIDFDKNIRMLGSEIYGKVYDTEDDTNNETKTVQGKE